MRILGITGSLRQGSYNRSLLRAARELLPDGVELVEHEIGTLPFYDGDVEAAGDPESVVRFKQAIRRADAILIATPEYNRGVPGVLKNAIDWASRPPDPPLLGKPAALMGASRGMAGTIRAQLQLRQCFVFTQTLAMPQPEVVIAKAQEKFDANGNLTDDRTRAFVGKMLEAPSPPGSRGSGTDVVPERSERFGRLVSS
jgi:chromate reductase, NAD(P)H dehydrogenase (quinone)